MTTITIVPEPHAMRETTWRAVAGPRQSVGKTAGEALDALTAQLNPDETGTLLVVQAMRPDPFFTAEQQQRLGELMERWRTARDTGMLLPSKEQAELDALIAAELAAATQRAASLLRGIAP
ncbi:MAG TPA: hypothetical protein VH575_07120 [Gemmataceae bacterium]|jgi:hypothetical protein